MGVKPPVTDRPIYVLNPPIADLQTTDRSSTPYLPKGPRLNNQRALSGTGRATPNCNAAVMDFPAPVRHPLGTHRTGCQS